ncbi:MAG: DUF488 domain-containing protein [Deltaproteobacteria bacterium]|nr:DUF488 domain-containing protein [Deltaproteobacteria bacterium]
MPSILLKRVYDAMNISDGRRILVDRVWPRGMTKERLRADVWLKSVAPSTGLRKWFKHNPAKWNGFKDRYFLELDRNPEGVATLMEALGSGTVTLIYSAKDSDHNQAVALREYLYKRFEARRTTCPRG